MGAGNSPLAAHLVPAKVDEGEALLPRASSSLSRGGEALRPAQWWAAMSGRGGAAHTPQQSGAAQKHPAFRCGVSRRALHSLRPPGESGRKGEQGSRPSLTAPMRAPGTLAREEEGQGCRAGPLPARLPARQGALHAEAQCIGAYGTGGLHKPPGARSKLNLSVGGCGHHPTPVERAGRTSVLCWRPGRWPGRAAGPCHARQSRQPSRQC